MEMALAANRFFAKSPLCVDDDAEKKHFFAEEVGVFVAANVHRNVVNGVRPLTKRVEQTFADVIELAGLGRWSEYAGAIGKVQSRSRELDVQTSCGEGAGASFYLLKFLLGRGHSFPSTSAGIPFFESKRALNPFFLISS